MGSGFRVLQSAIFPPERLEHWPLALHVPLLLPLGLLAASHAGAGFPGGDSYTCKSKVFVPLTLNRKP